MNFNSLAVSDNAIYSDSLELNFIIRCTLEHQLIGASFNIIINQDTLIIESLFPEKPLSLYEEIFMIFYFFCGVIFNHLFPVSIAYFITRFVYFIAFTVGS